MLRRLLTVLFVLSLLLCLATLVLWIDSFWHYDSVTLIHWRNGAEWSHTFKSTESSIELTQHRSSHDHLQSPGWHVYWSRGPNRVTCMPGLRPTAPANSAQTQPAQTQPAPLSFPTGGTFSWISSTWGFDRILCARWDTTPGPFRSVSVQLAHGLLAPILAIYPARRAWRAWTRSRQRRRGIRGLCPTCSYDLRAHHPGDLCPECGNPIRP